MSDEVSFDPLCLRYGSDGYVVRCCGHHGVKQGVISRTRPDSTLALRRYLFATRSRCLKFQSLVRCSRVGRYVEGRVPVAPCSACKSFVLRISQCRVTYQGYTGSRFTRRARITATTRKRDQTERVGAGEDREGKAARRKNHATAAVRRRTRTARAGASGISVSFVDFVVIRLSFGVWGPLL